jgi:hypothetical protein
LEGVGLAIELRIAQTLFSGFDDSTVNVGKTVGKNE